MSQEPTRIPVQVQESDPLPDPHLKGPPPLGTLMVVAVLLLVTIAFWCLVLGIQQARA